MEITLFNIDQSQDIRPVQIKCKAEFSQVGIFFVIKLPSLNVADKKVENQKTKTT